MKGTEMEDGEIKAHDPGATMAFNAATGAAKQMKLARFDLIPAQPLWQLAELFGQGATFYAPRNWEKGYDWSLSFAASQRHLWQHWNGENLDPATGLPHVIHAAWHCLTQAQFLNEEQYHQFDDRPSSLTKGK